MSKVDLTEPFIIHLGVDEASIDRAQSEARSRGISVFSLDLTSIQDSDSLVDYMAREFRFPHEVTSVDAVLDLVSDLDWFGNDNGYLMIIHGMSKYLEISKDFVTVLPGIVDRWRSGTTPFIVIIDDKNPELQMALAIANQKLDKFGKLPRTRSDTGSVDVFVHGLTIS